MANPAFTQVAYRLRNDDGSETTATWIAAQDTNATLDTGVNYRVRFLVDESALRGWAGKTWNLYYSRNAGAYAAVTDGTPIQFAATANIADGADTTSQLAGGVGAFLADNNGLKDATGGATNSGSAGYLFELEWCLKIDNAQVFYGDTLALRVYDDDTPIAGYTKTPSLTVAAIATPSVSAELDGIEVAATAAALAAASASATLDNVSASAVASAITGASATSTLDDVGASATAATTTTATGSATLDDISTTATLVALPAIYATPTLDDVTATATATATVVLNASATLDDIYAVAVARSVAGGGIARSAFGGGIIVSIDSETLNSAAGIR